MELPWFLAPHLLSFAKECKKVKAKGHAKQAAASLSAQDQETIERKLSAQSRCETPVFPYSPACMGA